MLEKPDVVEWTETAQQPDGLTKAERLEFLERLYREAPTRERARDARLELARELLRQDQPGAAREHFEALWAEEQDDPVASRARYELARLAVEVDQDLDSGRRLLRETIVDTPPWAGADLALDYLLRLEKPRQSPSALAAELGEMAGEMQDDRLASRLYLEKGRLLSPIAGRANDALQAFRAGYARCPDCAATDDSLMEMADIYARFQQWEPATQALEIVAARTERSFFVGTYSSHRASDARMRLGIIAMDHLQDLDAARAHFQRFLRDFDGHLHSDRAAWRLVQIEGLTGSPRSHRRALENFIERYPHSRRVPSAQALLRELS